MRSTYITTLIMAILVGGCSDGDSNTFDTCAAPTAQERAAYQACLQTSDKAACEAAGGHWSGPPTGGKCVCQSGRENCRCSGPDDCLAGCVMERAGSPSPPTSCADVTEGHCAGTAAGCGCWLLPTPTYRCYD